MSSNTPIPYSWAEVPLGILAEKITKGSTPTTYGYSFQSTGINFFKVENVKAGVIDLASIVDFISDEANENQKKSQLSVNDVLFSIAGTIGEITIIKEVHLPANTNQAFAIISGYDSALSPKFLEHQLRSFVTQRTKSKARGGAMNNVSLGDLKELGVFVPPLNEQHRIVTKIEELFSELDQGIESLKRAHEQLKVYRQALLKHAFEGKLTEQWRKENADAAQGSASVAGGQEPGATKLETADQLLERIKQAREARYQQQLEEWKALVKQWEADGKEGKKPGKSRPAKPLIVDPEVAVTLPDLPIEWAWLLLGENNVDVFDGPFGSNLKTSDYVDEGVRVIRLENIGSQKFIDEKKSFISEEKYQQLKKHTVWSGDLVFSSFVTENTRVALVPDSINMAVNKADCFCVRTFGKTLDERFLEAYLSTRFVFKSIESLVHGVGRPRINTTQLKSIPIPMTSIAEQREIMGKLDMQLSEVSKLEEDIDSNLVRSEALRQSILKKAFSGHLVPQDPNDEPASLLLERIAKEKAEAVALAKKARSVKKTAARRKT